MDDAETVQVIFTLAHGEQHGFLDAAATVRLGDGRELAAREWHALGAPGVAEVDGRRLRVRPHPTAVAE